METQTALWSRGRCWALLLVVLGAAAGLPAPPTLTYPQVLAQAVDTFNQRPEVQNVFRLLSADPEPAPVSPRGAPVTKDMETAEMPNATFASVFTAQAGPQESQALETRERVWRKEDLSSVEKEQVRDHLGKLDIHKELVDIIARPLNHL
uniref:Uncharacterized protein n=1 Tax=Dromaius novaehollandiae TaxID=8790 RepID=A0A8C4JJQ2_DRONO